MKVNFTKAELKTLHYALFLATQYESSYIDALTVEYAKGPNAYKEPKVVPKEYRAWANKSRRNIKGFAKVKEKLTANPTNKKEK